MGIASIMRRRWAKAVIGLLAAAALASSCTLDAAVATDRGGRVVGIRALEVRSGALDVALALALEGSQLVLELRWPLDHDVAAPLF
jgi:hypothetical protein